MACIRIAKNTTNQESDLFNDIYNNLANQNEELADEYYAYFESDTFKNEFGNWAEDFKLPIHERKIDQHLVDDNGEPRLFYDNTKAKHYYVTKSRQKVYYPNNINKLQELYSNEAIRDITKILALKFIKPRISDNFNTLDLSERNETLSQSIKANIEEKANELIQSEDFEQEDKGETLKESLNYIDEWVRHVDNYFRELKLVYKETTESEEMIENEENTRSEQTFGVSSFERSTKDNISANIKLRLSLMVENKLDDLFYEPKLLAFDEVYSTLQSVLTDNIALEGEDLFEIYKQNIFNLVDKKPYFKDLYKQLVDLDENIKAEFVQAFNLDKNNFIGSIIDIQAKEEKIDGEVVTTYTPVFNVQNLSNSGGKTRSVKSLWHNNFVDNFTNQASQYDNASKKKFSKKRDKFNTFYSGFKGKVKKKEYNSENIKTPINSLLSLFDELGINTTEKGFNHYLDGLNLLEIDFNTRLNNLNKLVDSTQFFLESLDKNNIDLENNPFDNQNEFNKLAQAEAFYLSEGSDASIFSVGKSKWLYSYPSYLSNKVKEWKKDRISLLKHYKSTPYNQGSYYMRWLLALDELNNQEQVSRERIEQFELNIFNSLQEPGDSVNAVDNKAVSKNDALADLTNKTLGYRVKGNKTYLNTPTPADKSTQYQFTIPNELMVNSNARYIRENIVLDQQVSKIVYKYVISELNRIKQVKKEIEDAGDDTSQLKVHYHLGNQNGLKFQLFPSLNYDNFDSEMMGFELYDNEGNILDLNFKNLENIKDLDDLDINDMSYKLVQFINRELAENIKDVRRNLIDSGVFIRKDGVTVNKAIDDRIWNSYQGNNVDLKIAGDLFINNLISQVEYSKMFSGDIAYYKHTVDYKKRIPATYTDGLQLYLRPGEEYFNASVIEGVEVTTPYYEELKQMLGKKLADKYKNINATDAQAWITPQRWKFLLQRLGKWSSEYDTVFSKLMNENSEPLTQKELKMAAQPLKGVYFEINEGRPVFLKYSQAVLLPNVIKGNKGLETLYNKMVESEIDELITIDGVKVGAINPVNTHNADYSVKNDFTLSKMKLKNSGWKLQQDLPTKTFKDTDVGSQIQKNIFSGLANNLDKTFIVDGNEMSGENLISHINDIVKQLSDKGLESLYNEFGITPDYKINNLDRLNRSLIEELKSRGAAQNVIDALESGMSSFGIPGQQQKIQNVFAAMITKRLIKIQTNGGSFIQLSNYGFNKTEANKNGVRWTPWAKDTTHEPELIEVDGKKTIRPGGVLISGSIIAKYVPDWNTKTTRQLFGSEKNNYEDGLIDPKVLRSLIGYRIPNQGLASNDALEVVGILPAEMGDTVVAYTGITTKTGSDFDIDKMYIMMPSINPNYKNYKKVKNYVIDNFTTNNVEESIENLADLIDQIGYDTDITINPNILGKVLLSSYGGYELENELINDLINSILNSNSNIANTIKADIPEFGIASKLNYSTGDNKNGLGNQLIQAYKAVLTHPDTINDIMEPIDFEFIKDHITSLFPENPDTNLSGFNIINELNLKYEFIAGKAGVGITANQLVDHVRGMMANLSIADLGIGYRSGNMTVFDNEFSQPLTEADLNYYSKTTGKSIEGLKKIKVANSLSALMNAYVDIAKDPYVTRGNWTTQTANVGFMLLRAGVHPFKVNAIIGQPIIRQYIDFIVNSESKITNETGDMMEKFKESKILEELETLDPITVDKRTVSYPDIFKTIKYGGREKAIRKLFKNKIDNTRASQILNDVENIIDIYDPNLDDFNIESKSLSQLSEEIKNGGDNINLQMGVFKTFQNWNEKSKEVVKNINASKLDVNGYGKSASSLIIYDNIINQMLDPNSTFKGYKSKLYYNGEFSLLGAYKNNVIDETKLIMENNPLNFIVAHPTVRNTFNIISQGVNGEVLTDQKLADKLEKNFYTYFMSGFTPFNINNEEKARLLEEIPNKILKEKETSDNILINELDVKVGEGNRFFVSMNNRKKSPSHENDIITSWKDLLEDNPDLGNDLIKYAFLTSGLNMSINQFHTYIPYEWFAENNINDYINNLANELNDSEFLENFHDSLFRHNLRDNQLVRRVFPNQLQSSEKEGLVLNEPGAANAFVKLEITNVNPITQASESSYRLYKLEGYNAENKGVYTRSIPLGYSDRKGNKVYEYNYNNDITSTIFTKQNAVRGILRDGKDLRNNFKDMATKDPNYFYERVEQRVEDITEDNTTDSLINSEVSFEENGNTITGTITKESTTEENSYEVKTENGYTLKDISLLQPLNERISIKYPEEIKNISSNFLFNLKDLKSDEKYIKPDGTFSNSKEDIENYQTLVEYFNTDNYTEFSLNEAVFIESNKKDGELLIENLIKDNMNLTLQEYANYLLENSDKQYIDKNQLNIFNDVFNNDKNCK